MVAHASLLAGNAWLYESGKVKGEIIEFDGYIAKGQMR
jgi:hypothetical protein